MLIGCVCSLLPSSLEMDDDTFIDRWGTFFDEISQLLTGADRHIAIYPHMCHHSPPHQFVMAICEGQCRTKAEK